MLCGGEVVSCVEVWWFFVWRWLVVRRALDTTYTSFLNTCHYVSHVLYGYKSPYSSLNIKGLMYYNCFIIFLLN